MTTRRILPVAVALLLFGCDDGADKQKTAQAKPAEAAQKKVEPKDEPTPAADEEAPDEDPEDEPEAEEEPGDEPEAEDGVDPEAEAKVNKALEIAEEIEAKPDDLENILAAHEMTQAEFSALLYEIAEDPVLAVMYSEGREKEPEQG